jgi:hypothetical protein
LLVVWAVIGIYDTFVSQFIPPEFGQRFPKAWEIVRGISNYIPEISILGWMVILLVLLLGITVEYALSKGSKYPSRGDTMNATGTVEFPERISFIELLREAEKRGLNFLGDNPTIVDLCKRLRQAASDGTLTIWGRERRESEPLIAIPASHWREFNIDWMQAVVLGPPSGDVKGFADDNFFVGTRSLNHNKAYFDLHLNRTRALEIVDLLPWKNQTVYFVWVAACLWVDIRPTGRIDPTSLAYPAMQKIKGALATGLIKSLDGATDMRAQVRKEELQKLARHHKESPKFLFDD